MKYEITCSLLLRDKFYFPATQARSMAEKMGDTAKDLVYFVSPLTPKEQLAELRKSLEGL